MGLPLAACNDLAGRASATPSSVAMLGLLLQPLTALRRSTATKAQCACPLAAARRSAPAERPRREVSTIAPPPVDLLKTPRRTHPAHSTPRPQPAALQHLCASLLVGRPPYPYSPLCTLKTERIHLPTPATLAHLFTASRPHTSAAAAAAAAPPATCSPSAFFSGGSDAVSCSNMAAVSPPGAEED